MAGSGNQPSTAQIILLWLVVASIASIINIASSSFVFSSNKEEEDNYVVSIAAGCNERERRALLNFKQALNASNNTALSSWGVGNDCCSWMGVGCSDETGHVTMLNLTNPILYYSYISGEIDPSLLELKHLNHLDLSVNDFDGKPIPEFFGSFPKLQYLNLSHCYFGGKVPHQLGNLSSLRLFDLNLNTGAHVDNLHWLSHLSSLQYLDLGWVNLSMADDWLQAVNMIPSLSELRLPDCDIRNFSSTVLPHLNFTSLTVLDLSYNEFTLKSLNWLANLSSLVTLDLSYKGLYARTRPSSLNSFSSKSFDWVPQLPHLASLSLRRFGLEGPIPSPLWGRCNLLKLDLSLNNLTGDLNGFLESLTRCGGAANDLEKHGRSASNMRELDLSGNGFSGTIPESLGQLRELVSLSLSSNSFEGFISEAHFVNLTKLESLDLSDNSIAFNVSPRWIPPFQLKIIGLADCQIGPRFPSWLQYQEEYMVLDLTRSNISDVIPIWFWNLSSHVFYLYMSENKMYGKVPSSLCFNVLSLGSDPLIDLSSNLFEGSLPQNVSGVSALDLSNNLFSGKINFISKSKIDIMLLSNNSLYGSIPSSICGILDFGILDLSKNDLTGKIPLCLGRRPIWILDLSYNNLNGVIPDLFSSPSLEWLQLSHNNFSGVLPSSINIQSQSQLSVLDLRENKLYGSIPRWIGESLSQLCILILRSNILSGNIPIQLSLLSSLQILDLANNRLSGQIPNSFCNFTRMMIPNQYGNLSQMGALSYKTYEQVVMKGNTMEYTSTLSLVNVMDLSRNSLSGKIPQELTSLRGLQSLNLSRNHLEGMIPQNIGNLTQLESLDLSQNSLSGTIPSSLSMLTFLSCLNLSNNNLLGRIPTGNQLQTLNDSSIYSGNYDLCGSPLEKLCPGEGEVQAPNDIHGEDESDGAEYWWFFSGVASGFVTGFWLVCGILLFNKSWRIAYYGFFVRFYGWLDGLFVNLEVMVMKKIRG